MLSFPVRVFSTIIILSIKIEPSLTTPLYLCKTHEDLRFLPEDDFNETQIILRAQLSLPASLMSNGENKTFGLKTSLTPLHCDQKNRSSIVLSLSSDESFSTTPMPSFNSNDITTRPPLNERIRGKVGPHISPSGHLEYNHFYHEADKQYCISRLNESSITLEICSPNCGLERNLCLPKCCELGKVVTYWKGECQEDNREWMPSIYEHVASRSPISLGEEERLNIHYYRPFLNCSFGSEKPRWDRWPFSNVPHPKDPKKDHPAYKVKVLKNGSIMTLSRERKWNLMSEETPYCIDGFVRKPGDKFSGKEEHQLLFSCPVFVEIENASWIQYLYAGVLLGSSPFILLTAVIHALLLDKQNIHGLCILSQSLSLFFFYVTTGMAFIMSQLWHRSEDDRSPGCRSIAIISHFFFLTTFAWLTVVNFDLWLTFRSLRPISKISGRMRRFRLYSFIGWGIPVIMSASFVSLDIVYEDYFTEVITPDYAVSACYVASWARREYICSILSTVLPINLILIISTFKIFYDFKQGKAGVVLPKRAKGDKYSLKLFVKLLLVMGLIWTFDAFICWFYNDGKQPPWFIIPFDMCMFLQAFAVFVIFCCNQRTVRQLEEKYPSFKRISPIIRKILLIPESTVSGEHTDTTPTTPGGSRKFSSSSVMMGTLEKKRVQTQTLA